MKALKNCGIFAIAIALGLLMGFALRRQSNASARDTNHHATEEIGLSAANGAPGQRSGQFVRTARVDDSPLATALGRDLSMSDGVTRWLYWLEAIEKAQLTDFPRLAQLAEGNSIATDLLGARWIELNPRHLFETLLNSERNGSVWASLGNTLFKEWPKSDLQSAIAALSETNSVLGLGRFQNWRRQVASKLVETDPETGLKLFHDWSIDNHGPNTKRGVAPWAAKDPRHAAEWARKYPSGYATQLVMEEIGKEWAQVNPAEAMDYAVTTRDQFGNILAASALKQWTENDLHGAAEWLVSTDASTRNRLSPPFVEAWAKKDAETALDWCEANLTGSSLAQAVGGVLKGAAENDVRAAAELVNALQPSAARTEGALAVAQKWMPRDFDSPIAAGPEMAAWLAKLDSQSIGRVLLEVQWNWAEKNPRGFANFLVQLESGQVPDRSYAHLGRSFARRHPEEALEWAQQLPEHAGFTAGQEAFNTWFESQPEKASHWLDQLDSQDQRRDRYFESMVRRFAHEPTGPDRLALLPEQHRDAAREIVEAMPLPEQQREKFNAALRARE